MKASEYVEFKKQADELRRAVDRDTGALSQLIQQLKDQFDCDSLKEGLRIFKRRQRKEKAAGEAADRALEQFEKEYDEKL